MFKIEYEIGLNEAGRPCIELPLDYEQNPEDRFFTIEIARYILQDLHARRTDDLDQRTLIALQEGDALLGQLGDEIAEILYNNMKSMGVTAMMFDSAYNVVVESIEERDSLPDKDIIYSDKIFDREEGLRVYFQYTLENYDKENF